MKKVTAIKLIGFLNVMAVCTDITFGAIRQLRNLLKEFNQVKTEFDELKEIEADDKEEGLDKFLSEEIDIMPLDVTLFDNVTPKLTGVFLTNEQGEKSGKELTYVDVLLILESLGCIK